MTWPFVADSMDRHRSAGIFRFPDSINAIMVWERPTSEPIALCEMLFSARYALSCSMFKILRTVIIKVKRIITFCECLTMITYCNLLKMEEWAIRAKTVMLRENITQDDVAEKLGTSQGCIAHWLSGRRSTGLKDFLRLAKAIGESSEFLLTGENKGYTIHDPYAIQAAKHIEGMESEKDKRQAVKIVDAVSKPEEDAGGGKNQAAQ